MDTECVCPEYTQRMPRGVYVEEDQGPLGQNEGRVQTIPAFAIRLLALVG